MYRPPVAGAPLHAIERVIAVVRCAQPIGHGQHIAGLVVLVGHIGRTAGVVERGQPPAIVIVVASHPPERVAALAQLAAHRIGEEVGVIERVGEPRAPIEAVVDLGRDVAPRIGTGRLVAVVVVAKRGADVGLFITWPVQDVVFDYRHQPPARIILVARHHAIGADPAGHAAQRIVLELRRAPKHIALLDHAPAYLSTPGRASQLRWDSYTSNLEHE